MLATMMMTQPQPQPQPQPHPQPLPRPLDQTTPAISTSILSPHSVPYSAASSSFSLSSGNAHSLKRVHSQSPPLDSDTISPSLNLTSQQQSSTLNNASPMLDLNSFSVSAGFPESSSSVMIGADPSSRPPYKRSKSTNSSESNSPFNSPYQHSRFNRNPPPLVSPSSSPLAASPDSTSVDSPDQPFSAVGDDSTLIVPIPDRASWFRLDAVDPIEKRSLPEFFTKKTSASHHQHHHHHHQHHHNNNGNSNPSQPSGQPSHSRETISMSATTSPIHTSKKEEKSLNSQSSSSSTSTSCPVCNGVSSAIGRLPPSLPPLTYCDYRNWMIYSYHSNPWNYLTVTECRKNLAANAAGLARLHSFLEYWGLINSQPGLTKRGANNHHNNNTKITTDRPSTSSNMQGKRPDESSEDEDSGEKIGDGNGEE